MGTKYVTEEHCPKCDFCGNPAWCDAPMITGSWAHACKGCAYKYQMFESAYRIGSIFQIREQKKESGKAVMGVCITEMEDMLMDSLQEIECPSCGEVRDLELDARGSYVCGCGDEVKIPVGLI